ncbi:glycosyltransferase [Candidatus Bathyarchaeota archaeon]|nr:glycosyltransferase [Candidatus Bathyarchaeota archaeon]
MRVCYVSPEVFGWGIHGGFGYITRTLSRELAIRGFDVSVVTQRRRGQRNLEELDGVKIIGFNSFSRVTYPLNSILAKCFSQASYIKAQADIYHSQEVSYNTLIAQSACPKKKHIITFQDPYDEEEWRRIAIVDPRYELNLKNKVRIQIERSILKRACSKADGLFTQAYFLSARAKNLFNLQKDPEFLPNPVPIPRETQEKEDEPTVCFLARWDPQKRIEIFFDLAIKNPEINFIAMGHSHSFEVDKILRLKYGKIPNLVLTGFVSEKEKSIILGKSWALVNTSIREALPVSFLEALVHKTPIISGENPDNLTKDYGYHVTSDDYDYALRRMIVDPDRTRKGEKGSKLVKEVYALDKVIDRHVDVYERILGE